MKSIKSICILLMVLFASSCAKDDSESLYDENTTQEEPLQLVKIGSWNSVSGMETVTTELFYATTGRLSKIFHNKIALTPAYNNSGKIISAAGVNDKGGVVTYTFEYNSAGQIVRLVHVFMNTTDVGYTRTFTYNTAGKVSRISTLSSIPNSTANVIEYVWQGDNIQSSVTIIGTATYNNRYVSYDTKLSPYKLNDGLVAILSGFAPSKNNFTELTTTSTTGAVNTQKRAYTYHTSGYAINVSLSDGGNELTRFYYNK